jgi:hypothetical protein
MRLDRSHRGHTEALRKLRIALERTRIIIAILVALLEEVRPLLLLEARQPGIFAPGRRDKAP